MTDDAQDSGARGNTPSIKDDMVLSALLTEYTTLRQEILCAIDNRIKIVTFSFGALAVIVAGLLTRSVSDILAAAVALLVVPQVAKAALAIWLGEYHRSQRAGKWLVKLESRIGSHVGTQDAMAWEQSLVTGRTHMSFPYLSVVILIMGVAYSSIALGLYLLSAFLMRVYAFSGVLLTALVVLIAASGFEYWFLRFFRREWRRIVRQP